MNFDFTLAVDGDLFAAPFAVQDNLVLLFSVNDLDLVILPAVLIGELDDMPGAGSDDPCLDFGADLQISIRDRGGVCFVVQPTEDIRATEVTVFKHHQDLIIDFRGEVYSTIDPTTCDNYTCPPAFVF